MRLSKLYPSEAAEGWFFCCVIAPTLSAPGVASTLRDPEQMAEGWVRKRIAYNWKERFFKSIIISIIIFM